MTLLRVAIVDDEPLARQRLTRLLGRMSDIDIAGDAASVVDGLELITAARPDVVLLDIEMAGETGFDLLHALRDTMPLVVFVTAHDSYAVRAFDAAAIDYILKPVDPARLAEALSRARARIGNYGPDDAARLRDLARVVIEARRRERITLRESGRTYLVRADDIIWVEAKRNYALVHLRERTVAVRESMERMQERLPHDTFARVHRSAIINVDHIRYVEPWFRGEQVVILDDSTRLTTSRTHGATLQEFLQRATRD